MNAVDNNDGNGDHMKRLTKNLERDVSLAWSPNGKTIAFTSRRNGDDQIFVMNNDGSKQKSRTKAGEGSRQPDWQTIVD